MAPDSVFANKRQHCKRELKSERPINGGSDGMGKLAKLKGEG